MKKMNWLDWVAFVLLIIGGLNWGLVGFFNYNLVTSIFGDMTTAARVVYDLVGLSALYLIFASMISNE
jgi:hypothetical protein